jgi:hypothetical protein
MEPGYKIVKKIDPYFGSIFFTVPLYPRNLIIINERKLTLTDML